MTTSVWVPCIDLVSLCMPPFNVLPSPFSKLGGGNATSSLSCGAAPDIHPAALKD